MNPLSRLVGTKWVRCADGPDTFDCWGLVRFVYRTQLGIELPAIELNPLVSPTLAVRGHFQDEQLLSTWRQLERPEHLCVVAMAECRVFCHVGIFLSCDGGVVLHTGQRTGCVVEPLARLKRSGYHRFKYYRYGAGHSNTKPV